MWHKYGIFHRLSVIVDIRYPVISAIMIDLPVYVNSCRSQTACTLDILGSAEAIKPIHWLMYEEYLLLSRPRNSIGRIFWIFHEVF